MCLLTRQKKPIILKKNKIVYKILKESRAAIYQEFKYDLNTLYKTNIYLSFDETAFDNISMKKYKDDRRGILKSNVISLGQGFHAFTSIKRIEKSGNNRYPIFKCTIPAGSEFYKDTTGLCVSNQIIINELIE